MGAVPGVYFKKVAKLRTRLLLDLYTVEAGPGAPTRLGVDLMIVLLMMMVMMVIKTRISLAILVAVLASIVILMFMRTIRMEALLFA